MNFALHSEYPEKPNAQENCKHNELLRECMLRSICFSHSCMAFCLESLCIYFTGTNETGLRDSLRLILKSILLTFFKVYVIDY